MNKQARNSRGDTRRAVLDAALETVAEQGLQALTHRGVETRANVSHGVTTYYFKSRDALIEALYEHICECQTVWITELYRVMTEAARADPAGFRREGYTRHALRRLVERRSLALALYEMYLHAARNPHLAEAARRYRDRHAEIQADIFRSLGARDPEHAALRIISATEGLLLAQLAMPDDDFEDSAVAYIGMLTEVLIDYEPPPAQAPAESQL